MKVIKRTFLTAAVTVFAAILCLFITGAVLAACSDVVTLRFETNGGTHLDSVEGVVGTSFVCPADPEKEGYYFDGWYLSSDFSGERQDLPDEMPTESRTYYAKYERYPVLTIDAAGGTLQKAKHLIKPGVNLYDYLHAYIPEKRGLIFGGWYLGDTLLTENAVMTTEDIMLTARYKAEYSVDIYLQHPDKPGEFERSEALSIRGADWDGETLFPELPALEYFVLDESKPVVRTRVLRSGENVLEFYFLREKVSLTYIANAPDGSEREESFETRYGAHITLPEGPFLPDGYEFFGWSKKRGGAAEVFPRNVMTMGAEDLVLYGSWARLYQNVRGGGYLAVEEHGDDHVHRAIHTSAVGEKSEGVYCDDTERFTAGEFAGRLDGRGGYLLDDSGDYAGYGLNINGTDATKFGTLTLSFEEGSAIYKLKDMQIEGVYEYVYDEATEKYIGKYLFRNMQSKGAEGFLFELNEERGFFLREGEEKGEYHAFDGKEFSEFDSLMLDGFGNAKLVRRGETLKGTYRGAELADGEWIFEGVEMSFRFLLGAREWNIGDEIVGEERGYLVYDSALAGRFIGNGTLTLDGYGYRGEYISAGGTRTVGRFERDDVFVTLYGVATLKFTLQGTKFALTGVEAGSYSGVHGTLFLDGAGQATLYSRSGQISQGSYTSLGGDEYTFAPTRGASFRFKLGEKEYNLFDRTLYGNFSGAYNSALRLDGYGGGTYTMYDGRTHEITVGCHDGEFLEIRAPQMTLYFQVKSETTVSLIEDAEAGRYYFLKDGVLTEDYLVLNGSGKAILHASGEAEYGEYLYLTNSREVKYFSDAGERTYLLTEYDGIMACKEYGGAGVYSGGGETLKLDGYENATYVAKKDNISGRYKIFSDGAVLFTESGLYRFTLQGTTIERVSEYEHYAGVFGALYLEKSGRGALLRDEMQEEGMYSSGAFYTYRGEKEFSFKLESGKYYLYDEAAEKTFTISDGGMLILDGCGRGTYSGGTLSVTGVVELTDTGLILFRSERLASISGVIAFERTDGDVLNMLGEEYGEYTAKGMKLLLDGKGSAVYTDVSGTYEKVEGAVNEFIFSGGGVTFRFRIAKREDVAIFERYNESLAKLKGSYETEFGTLEVTAYEIAFITERGRVILEVLQSGEGRLIARAMETGELLGVHFGETLEISVAAFTFH